MRLLLEGVYLLLAFLDLEFTKHKIDEFGIEVELNPLVKLLVPKLGVEAGADLGIVLITLLLGLLGWFFPCFLCFLIGVRFCMVLLQRLSRL